MSNNWDNILAELKTYNNWCVSSDDSKRPLNPRTLKPASVTDRHTWGSFEEAVTSGMPHIGFVLTEDDPYVIIDFDDPYSKRDKDGARVYTDDKCAAIIARQQQIRVKCSTYEELSKSGRGLHLIGYGKIPSGSRRDEIEVYSDNRYMICTGNVIENRPVADIQNVIDALYNEIGNVKAHEALLVEKSEEITDGELMRRASESASNADKFKDLWGGDWCTMGYPSQSEADYALISILAFYTKSNEQVRRLFRKSGLGNRDKAVNNNKYIDTCLQGIRGKQAAKEAVLAKVDISGFLATKDAPDPPDEPEVPDPPLAPLEYPPGLIGDLAKHFYSRSVLPVKEYAIAAALGFMSGIAGRQYNISGTGLNTYTIVIGRSGSGKGGVQSQINKFVTALKDNAPTVLDHIGPSRFASGQGLHSFLTDKPCFLAMLGEFSHVLQRLYMNSSDGGQIELTRQLLETYAQSGKGEALHGAAYAKKDDNIKGIVSPSVSIMGETTENKLFGILSHDMISDGFLPRFSFVVYKGKRVKRNKNTGAPPNDKLLGAYAKIINYVSKLKEPYPGKVVDIKIDTRAEDLLDEYEETIRQKINGSEDESTTQLWNRAHLKAMKYAGLIAVSDNHFDPVVTKEMVQWAVAFNNRSISVIEDQIRDNGIGAGEARQESEIKRIIKEYLKMSVKKRRVYIPKGAASANIVHVRYIRRRARELSSFKNDRRGELTAITMRLTDMTQNGMIIKVPLEEAHDKHGVSARVKSDFYLPGPNF